MIYIILAKINFDIVKNLLKKSVYLLEKEKIKYSTIEIPGLFEVVSASSILLNAKQNVSAIITLGCIIKNETSHNEDLAKFIYNGLAQLTVKHNSIITNGMLHCNTKEQAIARSSLSKEGINYGFDATKAAIEMIEAKKKISI